MTCSWQRNTIVKSLGCDLSLALTLGGWHSFVKCSTAIQKQTAFSPRTHFCSVRWTNTFERHFANRKRYCKIESCVYSLACCYLSFVTQQAHNRTLIKGCDYWCCLLNIPYALSRQWAHCPSDSDGGSMCGDQNPHLQRLDTLWQSCAEYLSLQVQRDLTCSQWISPTLPWIPGCAGLSSPRHTVLPVYHPGRR